MNTAIQNDHSLDSPSITFKVDDVERAKQLLPEIHIHEALKANIGELESCSNYHAKVIKGCSYQGVLAAVYTAFSQHRPLVLSPDAIWLTIAQGVGHHMSLNSEDLRNRFVEHEGQLELSFTCKGWIKGSPENPWPEAFECWTDKIRQHVGDDCYNTLICDFSTTQLIDRTVSEIVMMDIFKRYFKYVMYCICGIPEITLMGTPRDWERLEEKVAKLEPFEMGWWTKYLIPICKQFVRASRGDIDLDHWQNICKLQSAYGGDIINGWIKNLFPYLQPNGGDTIVNSTIGTEEGFSTFSAPSGLSQIPFVWNDLQTGRCWAMEAIGGFVGVKQHQETMALEPVVGWAVRDASKISSLLLELKKNNHQLTPKAPDRLNSSEGETEDAHLNLPEDYGRFSHDFEEAILIFAHDRKIRFETFDVGKYCDWGESTGGIGRSRGPTNHTWYRIGQLADGRSFAINLDMNRRNARGDWNPDSFDPICLVSNESIGKKIGNPIIALTFGELLTKILECPDGEYWEAPDFKPYGEAHDFVRFIG